MLSDYKEKNVYYINMRFFMLILFHNILLLNNIVQANIFSQKSFNDKIDNE